VEAQFESDDTGRLKVGGRSAMRNGRRPDAVNSFGQKDKSKNEGEKRIHRKTVGNEGIVCRIVGGVSECSVDLSIGVLLYRKIHTCYKIRRYRAVPIREDCKIKPTCPI